MARRFRLKDLLPGGRPKGPGFGIRQDFYLSVLACSPRLPALVEVLNPKGEEGAVTGFGVPLRSDAPKDSIREPLIRGRYGLASPDQKTVLEMVVVGKEEAGFDPRLLLETDHGRTLPTEVSSRIIGAWNILQLTFRSFDPAVYPALDFLLACSSRLARLTDGVVADPIAEAYRLPAEIPAPHDPGRPFTRSLHVSLQSRAEGGLLRLFTRGMRKFDLPEFEIVELTPDTAEKGAAVLAALADLSLSGRGLKAGDALNLDGLRVLLAPGGLDRGLWEGIACLEVLPEGPEPMSRSLTSWSPGR